jgi:hypothetical protein
MAFIGNQPTAVPLTSSQLVDGIITTAKIADGAVVNVDVNSTAAIAYSKLNLATSIVNGDIANATIALAKLSATGTASASTFLRGDNSWASAGASAGQVIQVLSATDSTQRTTASASFVTASNTLSVTITPSSASNKILILVSGSVVASDDSVCFTIYRGATNLGTTYGMMYATGGGDWPYYQGALSMSYLDSPSTTSATTYQFYMRRVNSPAVAYINTSGAQSSITCLEIKG